MASKTVKTGVGVLGGGATLAMVFNLMTARLDDMEKKLDAKDKEIRTYVDFKHDAVVLQLQFMNSRQVEMNELLKTISERMYNERRGGKQNGND